MPFEDITAIVTGGAAGLGLAITEAIAARGAKVAIFDIAADEIDTQVDRLRSTGAKVAGYVVDVSDRRAVRSAVAEVRADLGPVLILVNNAGIEQFGKFAEISDEQWDRVMAVNLRGPFICTQEVLADMLDAQWGRIVNISSSSAQGGQSRMAAYVSSKAGVIGFTKSVALELGPKGVTVNTILPGMVVTPMLEKAIAEGRFTASLAHFAKITPVRRAGRPEDIANAAVFLCQDESSYITGQVIPSEWWTPNMSGAHGREPLLAPLTAEEWGDDEYSAFGALLGVPGEKVPRAGSGHAAEPLNFDIIGLLARHPQMARKFLASNGWLLQRGELPLRLRELAIPRVAHMRRSAFFWGEHVKLASQGGVAIDDIDRLACGNAAFEGSDRVVLEATDELLVQGRATSAMWHRLADELGTHQAMELIFIVGTYAMLAMAFDTWRLAPPLGSRPLPEPSDRPATSRSQPQ